MTLAEPPILRSRTTADFLATVPGIAGFTARNSIVAIPFVGKRSRGALRMDLPRDESTRTLRALGDAIIRLASQLPEVDGLAIVIYTDATFAEQHGTPHLDIWQVIAARIRRTDLKLKDACCVAADGWVSYLEPRRPADGHPLSLITQSRMALEVAFRAGEIPDVSEWGELPDPDPLLAEQVRENAYDLLDFRGWYDSFGVFHEVEPDPVDLAERVLAVPATELRGRALGELVAAAHIPALRDVLLLTLAGGRELGERTMSAQLEWYSRREETGESFDEQALARLSESGTLDDDLVMLGRSRIRPDADRLVHAVHVLRRAAAHAPEDVRAGVLCVLTWMLWARGSMSAAHRMHELARACDPQLLMVETLGWLLESGYPEWAYRASSTDSVQA